MVNLLRRNSSHNAFLVASHLLPQPSLSHSIVFGGQEGIMVAMKRLLSRRKGVTGKGRGKAMKGWCWRAGREEKPQWDLRAWSQADSAASQRGDDPSGSVKLWDSVFLSTKWSEADILQDPGCFQRSLSSNIISAHSCLGAGHQGYSRERRWEALFALSIPKCLRLSCIEVPQNVLSSLLILKTEKTQVGFLLGF